MTEEPIELRVSVLPKRWQRRTAIVVTYPFMAVAAVILVLIAATAKLVEVQIHLARSSVKVWRL